MWKRNGFSSKTWSNVFPRVPRCVFCSCFTSLVTRAWACVHWTRWAESLSQELDQFSSDTECCFFTFFLHSHHMVYCSFPWIQFCSVGASVALRPLLTDHVQLAPHPLFSDRQVILEWEVFCVFVEVNQCRAVCTVEPTAEYILMWLFSLQIFLASVWPN